MDVAARAEISPALALNINNNKVPVLNGYTNLHMYSDNIYISTNTFHNGRRMGNKTNNGKMYTNCRYASVLSALFEQ